MLPTTPLPTVSPGPFVRLDFLSLVFSAEFKRDQRDGSFKIIEVNARCWWYVEFAARCGMNVPLMAFRDALGCEVQAISEYQVGRALAYPYYDLYAQAVLWKASKLSGWQGLRSWLRADRPFFVWDDPLPALHRMIRFIRDQFTKRILRRPQGG